jgi:hypothetical protein
VDVTDEEQQGREVLPALGNAEVRGLLARRIVDLPAPLTPIMLVMVPVRICKDRSRKTSISAM